MRKVKRPSVLAPIWTPLYLVPQNMKVNSPCIALKSWSPLAMFDNEVGELQHFVFWGFGKVTRFVGIKVSFWCHLNRTFAGSRRVDLIKRPYGAVRYDLEFIAKYVIAKADLKFALEFEKVRVRNSTLYINAFHQLVCFLKKVVLAVSCNIYLHICYFFAFKRSYGAIISWLTVLNCNFHGNWNTPLRFQHIFVAYELTATKKICKSSY